MLRNEILQGRNPKFEQDLQLLPSTLIQDRFLENQLLRLSPIDEVPGLIRSLGNKKEMFLLVMDG